MEKEGNMTLNVQSSKLYNQFWLKSIILLPAAAGTDHLQAILQGSLFSAGERLCFFTSEAREIYLCLCLLLFHPLNRNKLPGLLLGLRGYV